MKMTPNAIRDEMAGRPVSPLIFWAYHGVYPEYRKSTKLDGLYPGAVSVDSPAALDAALAATKAVRQLTFLEVKCALGAWADLGRTTTTPQENKATFMDVLEGR